MCKAVDCEKCGLRTWAGCGLHIDRALSGVSIEDRCSGWKTGICEGQNIENDVVSRTEKIEQNLRKHFSSDIHFLEVKDVSGGSESKFSIVLALSKGFEGVKLLDRHRMVNGKDGALGSLMDEIHALEMKTWTKEQFEAKKGSM